MPGAAASMVVFLLIGVWHGFYWNAVLYGLWFGLLTAAGMLLDPQFPEDLQARDGIGAVWRL